MTEIRTIPYAEWVDEMARRGKLDCKFVCPVCGNAASPNDWRALIPDAPADRALRECIGRAMPRAETRAAFPTQEQPDAPERPCDYAAFGLFRLCTVAVERESGEPTPIFEFA